ncbi:MAG: dienelactone hydrolase family protein [Planctomycetia bacterium]|nr:dienelactone hydrolase family protein [Planctomycetia bacterium]
MMNRLGVPPPSPEAAPLVAPHGIAQITAGTFSRTSSGHPLALFTPLHYEPNYAYPLVVWLHGPADDEGQLKRIMPQVSLRNYVAVAPRGTAAYGGKPGAPGYTWVQAEVPQAERRLFAALETVRGRFNVSPRRVFLAGFDCGGTMAFRLAMNHPTRFSGVISFGGEFPVGGTPLARLVEARQVPIFLACGRQSQRYPSTVVCDNLKLFHSAGMNVTLRQYPCGQELACRMLADMNRWIMEIVTGSATTVGHGCIGEG